MKKRIKKLFSLKLIRYIIGGGLAALIDLACLYIFVEIFGLHYILGAILAFVISFIFGFLFQKYITFSNFEKKHLHQGFLFFVFQIIGLLLNLILLFVLVEKFGFHYMYVAIFNKFVVFIWNFIMNNRFNFK